MAGKQQTAFLSLVKQLERMFKIDDLFNAIPDRRVTLEQMANHLDCSTRTVERTYKVMKKFGAPIDTKTSSVKGYGTKYGIKRNEHGNYPKTAPTFKLKLDSSVIARIMSNYRMRVEQAKYMQEERKLKRVQSLLTEIE